MVIPLLFYISLVKKFEQNLDKRVFVYYLCTVIVTSLIVVLILLLAFEQTSILEVDVCFL